MGLGPGMACNEPDDSLDLERVDGLARIDPSRSQPVEAERTVGIDHDLDHGRVGKGSDDRAAHGRPEHRKLARRAVAAAHSESSVQSEGGKHAARRSGLR